VALLIVDLDKHIGNAAAWRETLAAQLPDLEVRIWPEAGNLADIDYLAFMHPDFDAIPNLPNLKAMFSRSAGVESFIDHPKLPKAPLCKVEPPGGDPMMTEYVVMHVLRLHRDMPGYQAAQANRQWRRTTIIRPEQRRVGFLGFGMMAKAPALVLKSLGFKISAWVRHDRRRAIGAVSTTNRYRGLPAAAHQGNRRHILCAHLCHDAAWGDADKCWARQACGRCGFDRRA
jgi:glyoxylate/hydroxypyruvate reductase A